MNEGKFARTHRLIIEKSMELFYTKGFDQVTTIDICEAAGIARPTFYLHFKTKDEVLAAHYEMFYTDSDLTARILKDTADPWLAIIRLLIFRINYAYNPDHLSLVAQYLSYRLNNTEDTPIQRLNQEETMLTSLVRETQKQGIIQNSSDPVRLASAILLLQDGVLLRWCTKGGSFDHYNSFFWNLESILMIHPDHCGIWKTEC